jgi:hypothetical protein
MSVAAFADTPYVGSITVTMKYNGDAVSGGSVTLYKVGNATEDDTGFTFTLTDDFAGSGAVLETEETADTAKTLATYASNHGIKGTTSSIGSTGKVIFKDLEIGAYLIVQNEAASGYETISPFLVNIPMLFEGEGSLNVGATTEIYSVNAAPKMTQKSRTTYSYSGGSKLPYPTATPTPTPKPTSTATTTTTATGTPSPTNKPGTTSNPSSTNNPSSTGNPGSTGSPGTKDNPSSTDEPNSSILPSIVNENSPSGDTDSQEVIPEPEPEAIPQDVVITPDTSAEPKATEQPKLPQTGQLNWPIPVLVIFGLAAFSIGWNLRFGKTRRR